MQVAPPPGGAAVMKKLAAFRLHDRFTICEA